jgi:hypothetical protein
VLADERGEFEAEAGSISEGDGRVMMAGDDCGAGGEAGGEGFVAVVEEEAVRMVLADKGGVPAEGGSIVIAGDGDEPVD